MSQLNTYLYETSQKIEIQLLEILTSEPKDYEINFPPKLSEAMRYATLNGGKRIRPFLSLQTATLFNVPMEIALPVATAIEIIHCYSLVHDDLPSMDNDDLRRGKLTLHKAFDESTAILAGDALLTLAFKILSNPSLKCHDSVKIDLIQTLSKTIGMGGMVGGQILDLTAHKNQNSETDILSMQSMKTGALFRFSCVSGAILAEQSLEICERLDSFGSAIGLAFQIKDDLLDLNGDSIKLGKKTKKDTTNKKRTLIELNGDVWAKNKLKQLIQLAIDLLEPFGEKAKKLRELALFIGERTY